MLEIDVTNLNSSGEGIGRMQDGRICFISGGLPGERVYARILAEKKDYARLRAVRVLRNSPERVAPPCPWFDRCGGCQIQHMTYSYQLEFKRLMLLEALKRNGKLNGLPPIPPCRPSPHEWGYRNKAAFPVAPSRQGLSIGFFQKGSHMIVPIDRCPILDPDLVQAYQIARNHLSGLPLTPYDETSHQGDLRHLVLRKGFFSNEGLLALVLREEPPRSVLRKIRRLIEKIQVQVPSIQNAIININPLKGNFIWGHKTLTLEGKPFLHEDLGKFSFELDASAFFQVNSEQALALFSHVVNEAAATHGERCLELFSGTGSLTGFLAERFQDITAVESWQAAVKGLRKNLRTNGMRHVKVYPQTAESFMETCLPESFDVVVLDPPRSGCKPEVLEGIKRVAPQRIVYVSCNPATLARDLRDLVENGYNVMQVTPFDMFPQTYHVETVVTLEAENRQPGAQKFC